MNGYIYIIKNDVNNLVYIGLTTQSIQKRWYDHVKCSKYKNSKFYRAIREIGITHFRIHILEECLIDKLNDKEREYIAKYDSFKNGYNSTLGGFGTYIYELDEDEIIRLYKLNYGITSIAKMNQCSPCVIKCILQKHKIEFRSYLNQPISVVQLDKDYNIINTFENKEEAYEWLTKNYRSTMKKAESYHYIKLSCDSGSVAFGYKWMYTEDIKDYRGNINYDLIVTNIELQRIFKRDKRIQSKSLSSNLVKSSGRPTIGCYIHGNNEEIYFKSLKDMATYFNNLEGKGRSDKQIRVLASYIANNARKGIKYKGYDIKILE